MIKPDFKLDSYPEDGYLSDELSSQDIKLLKSVKYPPDATSTPSQISKVIKVFVCFYNTTILGVEAPL